MFLQGGFKTLGKFLMAFFFSITTPLGIAIGIGIASSYKENSPTALLVEGIFDSTSAGILIYMSLVDLIATDFLSKRLQTNFKLQLYSYSALFCAVQDLWLYLAIGLDLDSTPSPSIIFINISFFSSSKVFPH